MTGEPITTVVGNLSRDPELRFTPSGAAVANFTIACTPRSFNKQTSEWDDGETLWVDCSVWRQYAENVAESLTKGMRVLATGRLVCQTWQSPEGEKRSKWVLQVDEVGPSLRYATAKVAKAERQGAGRPQQQGQQSAQRSTGQWADDPWASAPQGPNEDPPF